MLLDPHFRTIRGLAALVEKDWCAFGHKFQQRCGHGLPDKGNQERSPIFLQWLDMVHQVRRQYPDAFEFNDRLLVFLADHAYSGLFGTFLGDSERERAFCDGRGMDCRHRTVSVWTCKWYTP